MIAMRNKYYNLFLEQINSIEGRKRLLLHSCCGPCSSYVITKLLPFFDITVYYYNPNIEPYNEYAKRKDNQIKLIKALDGVSFIDGDYENTLYHSVIKNEEDLKEKSIRCYKCYQLRMDKTAKYAKDNNYDYFSTTLSVSPHKLSLWINEIGEKLQEKYSINFLYSDFKKDDGYMKSVELAKKYDLYRQDYCGCLMSLDEKNKNKVEEFEQK